MVAGMPRLTWTESRAPSVAKLDHSARTRPSRSMTTPSKSVGALTSVATSRLASRNCKVRDRGKFTSSMEDTKVASVRRRESPASPTTVTGSPGSSSRGSKRTSRTGEPSSSAGS